MLQHPHHRPPWMFGHYPTDNLHGVVRRAVIDHNDFYVLPRLVQDGQEATLYVGSDIVDGYDDRHAVGYSFHLLHNDTFVYI